MSYERMLVPQQNDATERPAHSRTIIDLNNDCVAPKDPQSKLCQNRNAPVSMMAGRRVPVKDHFPNKDPDEESHYVPSIERHNSEHTTIILLVSPGNLIVGVFNTYMR